MNISNKDTRNDDEEYYDDVEAIEYIPSGFDVGYNDKSYFGLPTIRYCTHCGVNGEIGYPTCPNCKRFYDFDYEEE